MNELLHDATSCSLELRKSARKFILRANELLSYSGSIPLSAKWISGRVGVIDGDFADRFAAENSIQCCSEPQAAVSRQWCQPDQFVLTPCGKKVQTFAKNRKAGVCTIKPYDFIEPLNANTQLGLSKRNTMHHARSSYSSGDHALLRSLSLLIGRNPDGSNDRAIGGYSRDPSGSLRRIHALGCQRISRAESKQDCEANGKCEYNRVFKNHSFHGEIVA